MCYVTWSKLQEPWDKAVAYKVVHFYKGRVLAPFLGHSVYDFDKEYVARLEDLNPNCPIDVAAYGLAFHAWQKRESAVEYCRMFASAMGYLRVAQIILFDVHVYCGMIYGIKDGLAGRRMIIPTQNLTQPLIEKPLLDLVNGR